MLIKELRKIRLEQKRSQMDVAERAGVAQVAVMAWEGGKRRPRLDLFEAWVGALGYKVVLEPITSKGSSQNNQDKKHHRLPPNQSATPELIRKARRLLKYTGNCAEVARRSGLSKHIIYNLKYNRSHRDVR